MPKQRRFKTKRPRSPSDPAFGSTGKLLKRDVLAAVDDGDVPEMFPPPAAKRDTPREA